MNNRLHPIIVQKNSEVQALYQRLNDDPTDPLAKLLRGETELQGSNTFRKALQQPGLSVIAEIKRKSPSKGALASIEDPVRLARRYQQGGAKAISILTDEKFFGGSLQDLTDVASSLATEALEPVFKVAAADEGQEASGAQRRSVLKVLDRASTGATQPIAVAVDCENRFLPLLRKDFIIDPIQIAEAAIAGASAILAIVAVLGLKTASILNQAQQWGLDVLVEVHTHEELKIALDAGGTIIGINNRNLQTFEVDPQLAFTLAPHLPKNILKVAESGITTPKLAHAYYQAGFDAVLIGEALVCSSDPETLLKEFVTTNVVEAGRNSPQRSQMPLSGITKEHKRIFL